MISCNDCVFCWDTGDLRLIVYLKATWQMEQQSLEPLRPSPFHAPATFFTSDAVLNVQEAFRRCFLTAPLNAETIHDNLLPFSGSASLSSCPHVFTLFLELKFVFGAWIHFYPDMSVGALILDLTVRQVGGHQVTHTSRSEREAERKSQTRCLMKEQPVLICCVYQ